MTHGIMDFNLSAENDKDITLGLFSSRFLKGNHQKPPSSDTITWWFFVEPFKIVGVNNRSTAAFFNAYPYF